MAVWDEVVLGELPPGVSAIQLTADGRHISWFEAVEGRARFTWDFVPGAPLDSVEAGPDGLFYSPRRDRVAFWGVRGEDSFVVIDGVEHGPHDAYSRNVPPIFSADGRRVAYGISPRGAFASIGRLPVHLVVDDEIDASNELAPVAAAISPDGARIAYVAESTEPAPNRWVVLDGGAGPHYDDVDRLTFSPDGSHFAYLGSRDGQWSAVLDGREGLPATDIAGLVYTADSSRCAFVMRESDRSCLVVGEAQGPWHDMVAAPVFDRSNRVAYLAGDDRRMRMIVGEQTGPEFDAILFKPEHPEPASDEWNPAYGFSSDGTHFAYIAVSARRGEGLLRRWRNVFVLVRDGAPLELDVDEVTSGVVFSPDGQHVAVSARHGREHFAVVDGQRHQAFGMVWPPRWGPDGTLAYAARTRDGKMHLVLNDEPGPAYDLMATWISGADAVGGAETGRIFEFSRDGRHIAAAATMGGMERPIVDNELGPPFNSPVFPVFEERRVSFTGVRGRTVVRASRPLD